MNIDMTTLRDGDTTDTARVSDADALEALRTWAKAWHGGEAFWKEEEEAFNALTDLTAAWIGLEG